MTPAPTPYHKSVLIKQVLQYLNPQPDKTYLDVTFGGGGHTRAILEAEPRCSVIALDWDKTAIEKNAPALQELFGDRLRIIWGNFALLYKILKKEKIKQIDGILADFGTSQYQIHEQAGFSFQKDTPLDMRMSGAYHYKTAATIVNSYSERELARIFFEYGEEAQSKKIARAIVQARTMRPITTTGQLAKLIESFIPRRSFRGKRGIHPATKVFQALRIEVNQELDNIKSFLAAANHALAPEGRLVCISFHSLEDRLVKNYFQEHAMELEVITPKPVVGSEEEIAANPSARSAKLRAAKKLDL